MNRLNLLFSLSSLSVILVTIERFSFTTKVLLQPYSFLRLHELVQMSFLILFTVIVPTLILKEVTHNFETLKIKPGFILFLLFIVGIYFYATGNGVHEVSSFNFNNFCDTKNFSGDLCGGFFFNDYYTGNIFYFLGAALMVGILMVFELIRPNKTYKRKDLILTIINSLIYAFAIFAYAAFDRVLVGLIYSAIVMIFALILILKVRKNYLEHPVTLYTALTYTLGTVAALIIRFH